MSRSKIQKGGLLTLPEILPQMFENFCILTEPIFIQILKEYIKNQRIKNEPIT